MDDVDARIVALLAADGRMTHREIAQRTGLSRSAAGARLTRLLADAAVVVRGAVNPELLGQRELGYLALGVDGPVLPVARAAAERTDATLVSITTGDRPVVVEVREPDAAGFAAAVAGLRALPGVVAVDTLVYAAVHRDVLGPVGPVTCEVDEVDLDLLRLLQADGRASYVALAEAVGLTPAAVRRRVRRLVASSAVRIGGLARRTRFAGQDVTGVAVRVGGALDPVVAAVLELPDVLFLAATYGRADLLLTLADGRSQPTLDVLERIRSLPGVRDVVTWQHLAIVKESYDALALVPQG
ncbi:Lrp/AsnC family transcriptional regulator [Pimelobacter simplex]|uniref:Lrp/AsnC family transcriptional regulator n=1 Tax=Nocardioides simplex TaxID=2045 RepID=UPI0021500510|nr:Lrp/AsnC family transcriptional regulator [Pimelobacter simplex]UUW89363.1 Lrp/AsnC family transcriptional regulator [Pimelobacter simplex]UUW93191.1 Lrp/AsnC family transcriptional regulator [Pimelobacter simplex]